MPWSAGILHRSPSSATVSRRRASKPFSPAAGEKELETSGGNERAARLFEALRSPCDARRLA